MTEQKLREGWQMVKFGDIAKHISKRVEPSETELDIYVGLEHLDPDSLKIKRHGVPSDVAGQKLLVKKGQIIFGKRRAYQRKVAVADWDCICSAHAMVLEAKSDKIIPEFLPFFMLSNNFMNQAVAISEGSLSPTIKWKVLETQQFILPPISIQRKYLNVCQTTQNIELLQDSLATASARLYLSVLTDIFKKGQNDPTWNTCALSDCADIQTGLALSNNRELSESTIKVPYLRVANVYNGSFSLDEIKQVEVTPSMYARYRVEKGDILIAEGGDYDKVGRGHIWNNEIEGIIHQNHLFVIRTNREKLLPEFFNYMKSSFIGIKFFLGIAQQTTNLATINSTQLKNFPCVFPSIDFQKKLINELNNLSEYSTSIYKRKDSISNIYRAILNG